MNASKIVVNGKTSDVFALRELDGPVMFERRGDVLLVNQLQEEQPMKTNHMRVVWGSFALLAALFVLVPTVAAAPTFKTEGANNKPMALTLLATPCKNKDVLRHIADKVRPDLQAKFMAARLLWDGKVWASCWIVMGGIVFSIDEEGSPLQPIPIELFKDDSV